MNFAKKPVLAAAVIAVCAVAAVFVWFHFKPSGLPDGIVGSNGRIEAVEIDVATKTAGRIKDVRVDEGQFVKTGQVLANMDTSVLQAQLREAQAQLKRAVIGIGTAQDQVKQRNAEVDAADAVVAQRQAEFDAARKQLARTAQLAAKGTASQQDLDDDRARFESAKAAVNAAKAQVAAAKAARGLAKSQVIAAQSDVEAVHATIQRIQVDIDDSVLRAPRDGRVQYLVARPGEVLSAGGVVLNMVDLSDVYMTFFLPTTSAGRIAIGAEARLVLDAAPQYVIPARISYVADVAQFTPKTVETAEERQKLMFRVKAKIAPALLKEYLRQVKTGLPGMAYVRLDKRAAWPARLQPRLP